MCKTPLLPKAKIEGFVIDRIKEYILTEENLTEFVNLTNEEPAQTCEEAGPADQDKWGYLQDKMIDAMIRLEKAFSSHIEALDI